MITTNVLQRVFSIRRGSLFGTIFTIDFADKQYVISARHLFEDVTDVVKVLIFHDSQWKNLTLRLIKHCPNDIDISVLSANIQLTSSKLTCEPTTQGIILGQDVFFLGFPFGVYGNAIYLNRDFPLPFIKKATLSCYQSINNSQVFFLDGLNNPGFSGGPVVFTAPHKVEYKVCSVISGYRWSEAPIYQGDVKLAIYSKENSGIIISYSIDHAIKVIEANHVGFPLPSS